MAWAQGARSRVVVDLLWETGGGPDGPGITIEQLVRRVARQPPPGIRPSAIRQYAASATHSRLRRRALADIIREDGAGGIDILTDPDGEPWFTESQAYRYLLHRTLRDGTRTGWVVRDGDRWRIASKEIGPVVPGMGTYNAETRAHLDDIDQAHAGKVNLKWALAHIDDPGLAELVLKHFLGEHPEVYHSRRRDFKRAIDVIGGLRNPDQIREVRMELAARTVPKEI
jgi:hypothetical protein